MSLGGYIDLIKELIDSMTLGYCINKKGAYVLTLYKRRVFMAKFIYYGKLDWKPRINLLTYGIEGYILVLFM